jgi:hypothetical protein
MSLDEMSARELNTLPMVIMSGEHRITVEYMNPLRMEKRIERK